VTIPERGRTFLDHYDRLVDQYGEERALRIIRQIGRVYARGFPHAAEVRVAIQDAASGDDIRRLTERWFGVGE